MNNNIFISPDITQQEIDTLLGPYSTQLNNFILEYILLISSCGIYIVKDNYYICFAGKDLKSNHIYITKKDSNINGENIETIIKKSSPTPLELSWENLSCIRI